jgi:hypothetical protein
VIADFLVTLDRLKQSIMPPGCATPEGFVLKHGRAFAATEATFARRRARPNQCFKNAAGLAAADPELRYVEGYILCGGLPLEHAWCVTRSGVVIDPTLRPRHKVIHYFGVMFSTRYLWNAIAANEYYGLLGGHSNKTIDALLSGEETAWGDPDFLEGKEPQL